MKIPDMCKGCIASDICQVVHNTQRCINFLFALESKLQSASPTNKQSESLLCPKCGLYGGKDYDVTPGIRYVCKFCGHTWKA